jgi:hypothetical protein
MTIEYDENPPLHPVRTERIPYSSWTPSGLESLPPGWVNVRIWSYDRILGCDLYVVEECPGILHLESTVTETVLQLADPDDNLFTQYGDPWDDQPVVIDTSTAEPPHQHKEFVDPTWKAAYLDGGYLGTCPADMVAELLADNGFADAIPRPAGWVDPEDEL